MKRAEKEIFTKEGFTLQQKQVVEYWTDISGTNVMCPEDD